MTRVLVLALAVASCAPAYSVATRREPPVWLFVADMVAFSAGMCVGINEFNARPEQRDDAPMWSGFAVALASWLPYWLVSTEGGR